ncbi:MAG TPA: histidine kinase [Desulfovibrio sp.]|nr:histidine kinase [Desulfovibrio sp.]
MTRSYELENLINIEMLQTVQDNFSDSVGFSLITVDTDGVPVTRPSGFSPFCSKVRIYKRLRDQCQHCDRVGGRTAVKESKPTIYRCHCGLIDLAVPIILRDKHLGTILAGQVRLEDEYTPVIRQLVPYDDSWEDIAGLPELYESVPTVSVKKLNSAANTLFHLANYIVEQNYSNSITQQLHAKNMEVVEESKRALELEKSLRESELKALAYQVNPHFLFNVLNAIGRLAYFENARKTEKVVYGFSDMMRYVLNKEVSQFVTVRNEVQHVGNYLYLQQIRMSDKFTYSIDVPEVYNSILCPFMVLQPIVENSINYAIELSGQESFIKVRAYDDGTDLTLEIEDNGDGIDPAKAKDALEGKIEHAGRGSIGLFNVNQRLVFSYGNDYKLRIESPNTPGGGTLVKMRFPLDFDIVTS